MKFRSSCGPPPPGTADKWLFYYQGYHQAQDRFLQMDIARRLGQGRLSEILGAKAIASDRRMIGVGLRRGAEIKTAYLLEKHPEAYELLEWYAKGVNEFIAQMPSKAPDLLKNYRQITGDASYLPENWQVQDSVAVTQNMAFYLSSGLQDKLMLGQISAAITGNTDPTTSRLASKLDLRPVYNTFILDADRAQNGWRNAAGRSQAEPDQTAADFGSSPGQDSKTNQLAIDSSGDAPPVIKLPQIGCLSFSYPFPECGRKASFGSNNWVVSREFAGGDEAFLCNDPHLRLTKPFNFHAGGYNSKPAGGTLESAGYGLVGVGGVLIGYNREIAWGFTNNPADVDDIYLEMLDETKTKVWDGRKGEEHYEPIEVEKIVLKVRNAKGGLDDYPVDLRWIKHHGPIFSDHIPEVKAALDGFAKGHAIKFNIVASYRWVGHQPSSEFAAMLGVNRASNFSEFKTALLEFKVGAQNMVFADRQGDIGYYSHGSFPMRPYVDAKQAPFAPVIPYMRHLMQLVVPAFAKPAEWSGFRRKMPELHNPASGRIVTANNDPFGHSEKPGLANYQDYFGFSFSTGARAQRITELLDQNRGRITAATMQRIQTDHVDLLIKAYLQMVRAHRADFKLGEQASRLVDRLLAWNSEMAASKHEPLLADAWLGALTDVFLSAVAPEVNAQLREGIDRTSVLGRTIYHKLKDGLEGEATNAHKFAVAVISAAFEKAAAKVQSQQLQEVPWGRMNRLHFYNPIADLLPTPATDAFPIERDGSWETIDVAGPGYGPNFRLIVTLKKDAPIEAITSVPGGNYSREQKAETFSELTRWQKGNYRPMVPIPY